MVGNEVLRNGPNRQDAGLDQVEQDVHEFVAFTMVAAWKDRARTNVERGGVSNR